MKRRRLSSSHVLRSLALCAVLFVGILALPFGTAHRGACSVVRTVAARADLPCGLSELRITLDTSVTPFLRVSFSPISL